MYANHIPCVSQSHELCSSTHGTLHSRLAACTGTFCSTLFTCPTSWDVDLCPILKVWPLSYGLSLNSPYHHMTHPYQPLTPNIIHPLPMFTHKYLPFANSGAWISWIFMSPAGIGLDSCHMHTYTLFLFPRSQDMSDVKSITWHACAHSLTSSSLVPFLPFSITIHTYIWPH